ncbi:hypothetical protein, partial [Oceaniferula marina]|uniref:hypothetical protein n=1 Tax=Oceaniferula marina TaxID=2748318 RepID=UPI001D03F4FF
RACRYAPAPPFHLSSYGEPSKTKPKVRSANHQQNSLFTGNKKETTSKHCPTSRCTRPLVADWPGFVSVPQKEIY